MLKLTTLLLTFFIFIFSITDGKEMNMESFSYELDTFGSKKIDEKIIHKKYEYKIKELVKAWSEKDEVGFAAIEKELQNDIKFTYELAYVKISLIDYLELNKPIYLTIDVVEKEDVVVRMPFKAAPAGHYQDPDKLFETWDKYIQVGLELQKKGELKTEDFNDSNAFHCIFGHRHPFLAPYLDFFKKGVHEHKRELEQIFLDAEDENQSGNAAFFTGLHGRWK